MGFFDFIKVSSRSVRGRGVGVGVGVGEVGEDHGDVVFLTAPRVVVASFYGAEMALSSDLRDFLYHAVAESASWPLGGCSWSW